MNIKSMSPCKINGITENGEEKIFTVNDFLGNMKYLKQKAAVAGVNRDSIQSHKKFMKNEELNFILLSDPDKKLIDFFGVWGEKPAYGMGFMGIIRSTFIINPDGEIVKSWFNVNVEGHVEEVLKTLENA